ncbi:uncharacterized protein LOC131696042 [Topomyia yanbarensis]|uniref:uncharacterized protein LOC131695094 n=1 Tax=Topomyia yanbarensis TaxID=2498891 RepID=UPI00273BB155|nr:uncharacterized protein LOC131695094 [Topomyia yanbarensis]XP_058839605.1 uncharacterized protein LOC131695096 [Topomyia yanbarensis]XP_058839606.1 uncharacterized protein LOC131695097 [Topomyia yanbarensis]XP_058840553.1 uncharacterized protein LOC131696042 [Topomyia yanbarensis]
MPPHGGSGGVPALGGSGFPALGQIPQRQDGRFLVIRRTDEGQSLEKVSPFLIDKVIRNCCGDVSNVKRIRDGQILVQTKTEKQANSLKQLKNMTSEINVEVTEHVSLNTCRVVITCQDLFYVEDGEILEEMRDQTVTKVDRIMRKQDGKLVKTATFILTIGSAKMPSEVKVGFRKVAARPYYPRPLRCFQCLQFGHLGKHCKQERICANCSEKHHADKCDRPSKCANCEQAHSTISVNCPVWIKENEVVRVKIDRGLTHWEAKKIVDQTTGQNASYAERVGINVRTCNCKCSCGIPSSRPIQIVDQKPTQTNNPTQTSKEDTIIRPSTSKQQRSPTHETNDTGIKNPNSPTPQPKRIKKSNEIYISSDEKSNNVRPKRKPGRPKKKQPPEATTCASEAERESDMEI